MIINRVWAMPNKWTFLIPPIANLLKKYVGDGKGWVDPFAGENSPAEFTNDLDKHRSARYHLEAVDFCRILDGAYKGVLIDPPYSNRQISEHYKMQGLKASYKDTSWNFYKRVYDVISPKIVPNGYAISFGWNSNGIGMIRGFKIEEILLVAHGGGHNDTIVTVERKIEETYEQPSLFQESQLNSISS